MAQRRLARDVRRGLSDCLALQSASSSPLSASHVASWVSHFKCPAEGCSNSGAFFWGNASFSTARSRILVLLDRHSFTARAEKNIQPCGSSGIEEGKRKPCWYWTLRSSTSTWSTTICGSRAHRCTFRCASYEGWRFLESDRSGTFPSRRSRRSRPSCPSCSNAPTAGRLMWADVLDTVAIRFSKYAALDRG